MKFVTFAGSRELLTAVGGVELVRRVVAGAVDKGFGVAVGCCVGADAAALGAALDLVDKGLLSPKGVQVFAVGGVGSGWWRYSAVPLVDRSHAAGCCVHWWAGGGVGVNLISRLVRRSEASVVAGDYFVGFFGPGRSRGTARSARFAASRGVPVFGFSVGGFRLPLLNYGRWSPVVGSGCGLAGARRWVPAGGGS